jgi:redox-sensitive bicupin YhaK (pirin superfamily)
VVQATARFWSVEILPPLAAGAPGTTTRNNIGRLDPDSSLDISFNPGANADVLALAVQADGKNSSQWKFNSNPRDEITKSWATSSMSISRSRRRARKSYRSG